MSMDFYRRNRILYARVSISRDHVSHISGIGHLPTEYILNDNHGFASVNGGSGDISLDMLHLNFTPHPSILHLMANVTGTRMSFVSHWRYLSRAAERETGLILQWGKSEDFEQQINYNQDYRKILILTLLVAYSCKK